MIPAIFLADSGASLNFTNNLNDFSEYNEIKDGPSVQTALNDNQLQVHGMGVLYIIFVKFFFDIPIPLLTLLHFLLIILPHVTLSTFILISGFKCFF